MTLTVWLKGIPIFSYPIHKWNAKILLVLFSFAAFNSLGQMRQLSVDTDQDNHIKKISLYTYSEGYIAFTKWIGYTTDSGRTFVKKFITWNNVDYNGYSVNLTFGFGISGVKAFNKDTLLVYGDYGAVPAILYSVDQGNNFKLVYQSQLNNGRLTDGITDLVFPQDDNIGFATEADRIIKTSDRGKSWVTVRTDPGSYFEQISYVDNNTLYVYNKEFSSPKLLKTTNGGLTWTAVAVPLAGGINAVSFISANKGWLNMYNADVSITYYTGNGGATWRAMTNPAAGSSAFIEMKFLNDSIGYALPGGYTVLKTLDSGKVWQPLRRDNDFSYLNYGHTQLFLNGKDYLWAGGMHGFLELSSNSGGEPLPKAFFTVDTAGYLTTGIVRVQNFSNPYYQYKWFVNEQLVASTFQASYQHAITSFLDSVKLIVTYNGVSDTVVKYVYFPVLKFPAITAFTPTSAGSGSQITITGVNFTGITSVKFGGRPAASFSIASDNTILAVVNDGATGTVSIANTYSSDSLGGFTFLTGPLSPPPVISGVSPSYGNSGTTITISGNNFNPVASQNIVYFGTTKAVVTSATPTQVSCIVPVGAIYSDISVLNASTSLKGISPQPFSVTFADSSNLAVNSFRVVQKIPYDESTRVGYINCEDLDGDGKSDLLSGTGNYEDSLRIYLNTSQGRDISFAPTKNIAIKAASRPRKVMDVDGDGKPDIVNAYASTVNIIRNISSPGNLAFEANVTIQNTQQSGPEDLALDDLDGDGRMDIAVAGYTNKTMSVLRNTSWPGLISFAAGIGYPYGNEGNPDRVAIADMDGDGKKDIITLNVLFTDKCTISFFKNKSTPGVISFADKINFQENGSASQFNSLKLRDYDGDGKPDVIICNDMYLQVLPNTSTGGVFSLGTPVFLNGPSWMSGAGIANLTGGVRPDIVTGNNDRSKFTFFRNSSTPGVFSYDPNMDFENYFVTECILTAVADFNGDGRPDVVGSSIRTNDLIVIENLTGASVETKVCIGSNISLSTDVGGSTYQWQEDSGSGFSNISDNAGLQGTQTATLVIKSTSASWNTYRFRCITDNLKSTTYELKVTGPIKPDVTASVPSLQFCKNGPVTFSATCINDGGIAPVYQWQINEQTVFSTDLNDPGNPGNIFTTSGLDDNDRVRVIVSSREQCSLSQKDTSTVFTMIAHGAVPSVSVGGPPSSTITCDGTPATFVATPSNGGTSPSYQWMLNGAKIGGNDPVLTAVVPINCELHVVMTSNSSECNIVGNVTSNSLRPVIHENLVNDVSISTTTTSVCKDQSVTFLSNGWSDATASFEWKVNDITVATQSWYYMATGFADGSKIKLLKTTHQPCTLPITATSNIITLKVSPTVAPSLTISGNTVVTPGQSTVLTAMPVNGGTAPQYQWEDSVSANGWKAIGTATTNPTLTFKPAVTGHKLRCTMKSNANCLSTASVTSDPLTFTVQAVTAIDPVPSSEYGIISYPNPAYSTLTIDKLRMGDLWQTLEIKDNSGRQIMAISARSTTTIVIPVAQLPSGFYIAVLRRKSGESVYLKFIKI